jgi:hypothetical protein
MTKDREIFKLKVNPLLSGLVNYTFFVTRLLLRQRAQIFIVFVVPFFIVLTDIKLGSHTLFALFFA